MAEAVVSFVVKRLGDFTIKEVKFLYGASNQVKHAQTELQFMRGFLKDADVRQRDDETVRLCVAEIRDAVYDLEDVIDNFVLEVAYKREGVGFKYVTRKFACFVNGGVSLHKVGSEIDSITTRISELRLRMQTYNIREIRESGDAFQLSERQQQLRRTYSHIGTPVVVGLDDDVNKLVMQLVKEENCHRVVSIWGMGGLGKTTLAKQVYHHKKVRSHFDSFAWMCISQRCNAREVWVGILHKLISPTNEQRQEIAHMTNDEIAKKLFLVQKEGKCLVVFDDIWSIQTWESLKAAFPVNEESKSKILLTTRNKEVALYSDIYGFLHEPRPLSNDESWELFEKITIIGRDQMYPEIYSKLKELGKEMLQHCAGLPLAVTVLAGILKRKDTVDEWEAVSKNVHGFLRWGGKGREQDYSSVSRVLELSYDDLPYQLKPCFLYLGHFPEDSMINVKELTQLWIAEGFICSENQRQGLAAETMEDVAYNWLIELVERCVVQVGKRGTTRKIKSCCLHDLVRDMCLLKAEEESFLQVITLRNNEATHLSSSKTKPVGRVRRLAIHVAENVDKSVSKDEIDDRIRSLLYFTPIGWRPTNNKLLQSMFKDFRLLRVLKLEWIRTEVKLPSSIGKMFHLRYLSLRGSIVTRLPSSLSSLTCLQTLNLDNVRVSRFWVKKLFLQICFFASFCQICCLSTLVALGFGISCFGWCSGSYDSYCFGDEPILKIPNGVGKMKQLRHLHFPMDYSYGKQKLSYLCNLQTMQISSNYFEWIDLAELTNLRKLIVRIETPLKNMEETLKSTSSTLNRIRSLHVTNGFFWNCSAEIMQIVSSCRHVYKLRVVYSLLELPKDPHHYPNLTKLSLNCCKFKDDQMAIIEKLPNLRKFIFEDATFEENKKTLVCSKGGFPHLEVLIVHGIDLKEWVVEEGAMPNLSELSIDYWKQLMRVPEGLRYIQTLRELNITNMPRTFCSRLEEGAEDFYIVQHVHSITIQKIYDR